MSKDCRDEIHETHSIDHRTNEDISERPNFRPSRKEIRQYKENILNHVSRMEGIRYPKTSLTIELQEELDDN
jgi:hypothetical protein